MQERNIMRYFLSKSFCNKLVLESVHAEVSTSNSSYRGNTLSSRVQVVKDNSASINGLCVKKFFHEPEEEARFTFPYQLSVH